MELVRHDERLHVTRRSLLRLDDFRRVITGQFISQTADAAMLLVLAKALLFADANGPTPLLLGQAAVSTAIPLVLAGPIAGVIADRWPRKQVLVTGQALRSILAVVAILAIIVDIRAVTLMVFVLCLCASRLLYTARVASVRHLVRQHELVAADSLMLILGVVAGVVGAAAFAALTQLHLVCVLVAVAIGHFGAAYFYDRTRTWLGGEGQTSSIQWRDVAEQLSCGKTRYAILATSLHRCFVGFVVAAVSLDLDGRTGGSASGYAGAIGAVGFAGFLGSLTSEWMNEHLRRRALTIGAFAASGLAFVPVQFLAGPTPRLVALGVAAFAFQNLRVASDATIQANAVSGSCGRVFAAYDIAFNLAYVAGVVVGLAMTSSGSVEFALTTVIPAFFIGSLVFAVIEREPRREESRVYVASTQGLDETTVGVG